MSHVISLGKGNWSHFPARNFEGTSDTDTVGTFEAGTLEKELTDGHFAAFVLQAVGKVETTSSTETQARV